MRNPSDDPFGGGMGLSIALHLLIAGGIAAAIYFGATHFDSFGSHESSVGAVQASMVDAIPLPTKAPSVKDNVLTPDNVNIAPPPPPKEATQTPPKATDIEVKAQPRPIKLAADEKPAPPKHPQPTPPTTKATTGEAASQIPQAIAQAKNGTATLTVEDRNFGVRYSYYQDIMQRAIGQAWYTQEADPRTSVGKSVVLIFDVNPDGTPSNVHVKTSSGSPTLDTSAVHALERVNGFGPTPDGRPHTVTDTFLYHAQ
jgi:protein TonB